MLSISFKLIFDVKAFDFILFKALKNSHLFELFPYLKKKLFCCQPVKSNRLKATMGELLHSRKGGKMHTEGAL